MGSRVVIDQHALATGCVHWKRTVPCSNVVERTAQTICTGYKESIMVLESGYFFDYLCHWNRFLLSLLIFNLILYISFFKFAGEGALGREQLHGRKVTLAGSKSDIGRAEKSHKGQNVTLTVPPYQGMTSWDRSYRHCSSIHGKQMAFFVISYRRIWLIPEVNPLYLMWF